MKNGKKKRQNRMKGREGRHKEEEKEKEGGTWEHNDAGPSTGH